MRELTFDERNLICIYLPGTRAEVIAALEESRIYLEEEETERDENDMRRLIDDTLAQLRRMTDAAFDALDLFPDYVMEGESNVA